MEVIYNSPVIETGESEARPMERKAPRMQSRDRTRLKVLLLMVRDKELSSNLIEIIEQETSYCTLLVDDSQQALEVTKDVMPDLLLLDYRLQEKNGITLYNQLKAIKRLRETPALIINAPIFHEPLLDKKRQVICLSGPPAQEELLSSIEKIAAESSRRTAQGMQRRGLSFFIFKRKA